MPSIEYRPAMISDAEFVLQFWKSAGATVSSTDEIDSLKRVIENPAACFLIAVSDKQIIGTLIGTFDGWRGNMYRLVVEPKRRRQGIGRELVRHVESYFAEQGARRITALVESDHADARGFWTAVGYAHDERIIRHAKTLSRK